LVVHSKDIENAAEYNLKYKVKVGGKKANHPTKIDIFFANLSDDKKLRWARSYMTFLDYYIIYSK
jgi:hypothetical protein